MIKRGWSVGILLVALGVAILVFFFLPEIVMLSM
jgi:hypothetical protein